MWLSITFHNCKHAKFPAACNNIWNLMITAIPNVRQELSAGSNSENKLQ